MSFSSSRRVGFALASLALLGCSVIATSDAPQCANDNDCFVKFGGGYACQAGGCVKAAAAATPSSPVVTTLKDCRATQECVAALGEGFLCRRDRNDPQKKGVCQQLTPATECQVMGDYKNDNVIILGALVPGRESPALARAVRAGLERAIADWSDVERQLQTQTSGADFVAPPRPFAFITCSEDVPVADLTNIYLNSGTRLVVGPATMNAQTEALTAALTNAKIVFVSPTSLAAPAEGANVGTFFFRVAGSATSFKAPAPNAVARRSDRYATLEAALAASATDKRTYVDPAAPGITFDNTKDVLVLDDGAASVALPKLGTPRATFVLPTAIPDVAAAIKGGGSFSPVPRSAKRMRPTSPAPFPAIGFGDSETYDATYLSLAALAAVDSTVSAEDVQTDVLQAAVLRVSTPGGKAFEAQPTAIRDLLVALRATPPATISLNGATGSLAMTNQATTGDLSVCTVGADGCQ